MMTFNWIAHSQSSRTADDDSVTISRNAQRTCVKCLQNAPLKDSIIVEQQHRIELKDSTIQIQNNLIEKADVAVHDLDGKLSDCNVEIVDLERKRKRGIKIAGGIGAGGGVVIGWFSGRLIK